MGRKRYGEEKGGGKVEKWKGWQWRWEKEKDKEDT